MHGRNDIQGDVLHGGEGNDTFKTRDGEADVIDCGPGVDTALLDFKDVISDATAQNPNGSCEVVNRQPRAKKGENETEDTTPSDAVATSAGRDARRLVPEHRGVWPKPCTSV